MLRQPFVTQAQSQHSDFDLDFDLELDVKPADLSQLATPANLLGLNRPSHALVSSHTKRPGSTPFAAHLLPAKTPPLGLAGPSRLRNEVVLTSSSSGSSSSSSVSSRSFASGYLIKKNLVSVGTSPSHPSTHQSAAMLTSSPPGSPAHVTIGTSPPPSSSPKAASSSSSAKQAMSPPSSPAHHHHHHHHHAPGRPLWEQYILSADLPSDIDDNDDDEYLPEQDADIVAADGAEAYEYLERLPEDDDDDDDDDDDHVDSEWVGDELVAGLDKQETRWLKYEQLMPAQVLVTWRRFLYVDGGLFALKVLLAVLVSAVVFGLVVSWQSPLTLLTSDGWVKMADAIGRVRRLVFVRAVRFDL
ncbi:hypothetical protein BCR44DRAFT_34939 [Catenaria anguillulae PL171]|uniref:Uncharacterized protein n=1 Tax=Catenaria anguillulae PL171 TaxID=765915 RepID=A0A1Y2HW20_9FUNG|nr:hypothetical protein BCR44DRAFT_34939 [Catenaria anguillulae PL171]